MARSSLAAAAAAGLDLVEIPLLRPDEIDIETTVALTREHGVAVTCSLGLPRPAALPAYPQAARRFLGHVLEVAARLGSSCLTGVTYASIGQLSGAPSTEREYETLASALRPVAQQAARLGLALGLEPCNRYETHLLNTGRQCVELIERIDEPNVFLHFDTYHMNIEEQGLESALVQAGAHCRYVHLSESNRGIPGRGTMDWEAVFRGLAAVGFAGDLVLESMVRVHPDITRALAIWRPVAPDDSQAVVEEGFRFLRDTAAHHGFSLSGSEFGSDRGNRVIV